MGTHRDGIDNLGIRDTEVLAEFLLHHMGMETRRKLIGELPALYARLYPSVSEDIITEIVKQHIEEDRENA